MTAFNKLREPAGVAGTWERVSAQLNGALHEKSLWIYVFIVVAHWIEHLIQGYQVYVLNWARPDAKGLLGLWMPSLVTSEALHFGYAVFMLLGLVVLRPGFAGRARLFWNITLIVQLWHWIEHALLQWQAIAGDYLFGGAVPTSIFQIWIPRVELHLLYNALVTIPMLIAMYYHRYPPRGEIQHGITCTCAVR